MVECTKVVMRCTHKPSPARSGNAILQDMTQEHAIHPLTTALLPDGKVLLTLRGSLSRDRIDLLGEDVSAARRMIEAQYRQSGAQVRVLLELTNFDGIYVPEAIEWMSSLAKDDARYVEKTACFGGSSMVQLAGDVVLAFAMRDNIKFFNTQEEALEWLEK